MHCDVALFYHRRLSPYTTVYTHRVYVCTYLLLSLPIASFHPFRPQRDRCALGRAPLASLHTPFLSYNRLYALSSSIRRSHSDLRRSIGLATDSQLFSAIVGLPNRSPQWIGLGIRHFWVVSQIFDVEIAVPCFFPDFLISGSSRNLL